MSRHRRRARRLALLIATAALALPAGAHAYSAAVVDGTLVIQGAPADPLDLLVFEKDGDVRIEDFNQGSKAGSPLGRPAVGPGCFEGGQATGLGFSFRVQAVCSGAERLEIRTGDAPDRITVSAPLGGAVDAGGGDDLLRPAARPPGSPGIAWAGGRGIDEVNWGFTGGVAVLPVDVSLDGLPGDGRAGDSDNVATDVENVRGSGFGDRLTGSARQNRLIGMGGPDVVRGGDGNDVIDEERDTGCPSPEPCDRLFGGPGTDRVTYATRTGSVFVSPDGRADDGAYDRSRRVSLERDNVATDIEHVETGAGPDVVIGSSGPNAIDGRAGDDELIGDPVDGRAGGADLIIGGAGADLAFGGPGDDRLVMADGAAEAGRIECDGGLDRIVADAADNVGRTCEQRTISGTPVGRVGAQPRSLKARAGRVATWRLSWTHPVEWSRLDEVRLRLRDGRRRVAIVRFDQETGRARSRGALVDARASRVRGSGRRARAVLVLRPGRRLAGRTLTAELAARDDDGVAQPFRRAGRVVVRAP